MADVFGETHPILEQVNALQDSIIFNGLGKPLGDGTFTDGVFIKSYRPWYDAHPSRQISTLGIIDVQRGIQSNIAFAPPHGFDNPMRLIEAESDDEDSPRYIYPILARIVLQSDVLLTNVTVENRIMPMHCVGFDLLEDRTVIRFPDSDKVDPLLAEYDGEKYQYAVRLLDKFAPIKDLLQAS